MSSHHRESQRHRACADAAGHGACGHAPSKELQETREQKERVHRAILMVAGAVESLQLAMLSMQLRIERSNLLMGGMSKRLRSQSHLVRGLQRRLSAVHHYVDAPAAPPAALPPPPPPPPPPPSPPPVCHWARRCRSRSDSESRSRSRSRSRPAPPSSGSTSHASPASSSSSAGASPARPARPPTARGPPPAPPPPPAPRERSASARRRRPAPTACRDPCHGPVCGPTCRSRSRKRSASRMAAASSAHARVASLSPVPECLDVGAPRPCGRPSGDAPPPGGSARRRRKADGLGADCFQTAALKPCAKPTPVNERPAGADSQFSDCFKAPSSHPCAKPSSATERPAGTDSQFSDCFKVAALHPSAKPSSATERAAGPECFKPAAARPCAAGSSGRGASPDRFTYVRPPPALPPSDSLLRGNRGAPLLPSSAPPSGGEPAEKRTPPEDGAPRPPSGGRSPQRSPSPERRSPPRASPPPPAKPRPPSGGRSPRRPASSGRRPPSRGRSPKRGDSPGRQTPLLPCPPSCLTGIPEKDEPRGPPRVCPAFCLTGKAEPTAAVDAPKAGAVETTPQFPPKDVGGRGVAASPLGPAVGDPHGAFQDTSGSAQADGSTRTGPYAVLGTTPQFQNEDVGFQARPESSSQGRDALRRDSQDASQATRFSTQSGSTGTCPTKCWEDPEELTEREVQRWTENEFKPTQQLYLSADAALFSSSQPDAAVFKAEEGELKTCPVQCWLPPPDAVPEQTGPGIPPAQSNQPLGTCPVQCWLQPSPSPEPAPARDTSDIAPVTSAQAESPTTTPEREEPPAPAPAPAPVFIRSISDVMALAPAVRALHAKSRIPMDGTDSEYPMVSNLPQIPEPDDEWDEEPIWDTPKRSESGREFRLLSAERKERLSIEPNRNRLSTEIKPIRKEYFKWETVPGKDFSERGFESPLRSSLTQRMGSTRGDSLIRGSYSPLGKTSSREIEPTQGSSPTLEFGPRKTPSRGIGSARGTSSLEGFDAALRKTPPSRIDSTSGASPIRGLDSLLQKTPSWSIDPTRGASPTRGPNSLLQNTPSRSIDPRRGVSPTRGPDSLLQNTPSRSIDPRRGASPIRKLDSTLQNTPSRSINPTRGVSPILKLDSTLQNAPSLTIDSTRGASPTLKLDSTLQNAPSLTIDSTRGASPTQGYESYTQAPSQGIDTASITSPTPGLDTSSLPTNRPTTVKLKVGNVPLSQSSTQGINPGTESPTEDLLLSDRLRHSRDSLSGIYDTSRLRRLGELRLRESGGPDGSGAAGEDGGGSGVEGGGGGGGEGGDRGGELPSRAPRPKRRAAESPAPRPGCVSQAVNCARSAYEVVRAASPLVSSPPAAPHQAPCKPCEEDEEPGIPLAAPCCSAHLKERRAALGRALAASARAGGEQEVERLLDAGADVNFAHASRWTALHRAAARAHAPVLEVLLRRGGDAHARTAYGCTPLHVAAAADRQGSCVRALLAAGADPERWNRAGQTPLHVAAEAGNAAAVRLMLKAGASRLARDDLGNTPFDLAKKDCVRKLLKEKATSQGTENHRKRQTTQG